MGDDKPLVDESLLEKFTCPVCFDYMDKNIYICSNGHSVCGTCNSRISKCPICKVKLNSVRNITLEKAAKKVKECKGRQETVVAEKKGLLKRRARFSLGSPIIKHPPEEAFSDSHIQCPHSKCCYFTKHLLQLKFHLQTWHREKLYTIKKDPTIRSENLMRVRLYWDTVSVYNLFTLLTSEALFVVFITRAPNYFAEPSHFLNVLTVSDSTKMYKFSCGAYNMFSMFYQGKHQAQEGIKIDKGSMEKVSRAGMGALDEMGYEIEVIPINEYNRLSIEMFDREIFRCDIRNLMFNMPVEDDPVCQRAVRAVEEAKERMSPGEDDVIFSTGNDIRDIIGDTSKPDVQDASKADFVFETLQEGYLPPSSICKTRQSQLESTKTILKSEDKISKVKIMENKNTTFLADLINKCDTNMEIKESDVDDLL